MRLSSIAWVSYVLHRSSWAAPTDSQDQNIEQACQCTAVDYADSGSYLINGDDEKTFSYASRFTGKASVDSFCVLRDELTTKRRLCKLECDIGFTRTG